MGNPAPPRPTIPASFTMLRISSFDRPDGSLSSPTPSTVLYSPSFSTTMEGTIAPLAIRLGSMAFTVPETEAITFAEMKPPASPIFWPASTWSPFATRGFAGAPMCCDIGYTRSPFGIRTCTGLFSDSSFPSYGWMPPIKVAKPMDSLPLFFLFIPLCGRTSSSVRYDRWGCLPRRNTPTKYSINKDCIQYRFYSLLF